MSSKDRISTEMERNDMVLPVLEKPEPTKASIPAFVYVVAWISFSGAVILFNKYLLDTMKFSFPILLTSWHLTFGTIMTQILARTTTLLDGRKKIKMTPKIYIRAIVPIGFFFSLSLICGNVTYLYLSVSFIQMLKATMPVATLFAMWSLGLAPPDLKVLANVSAIVIGVVIATFGELEFVLNGFLIQMAGIAFEATRLAMVERLLSGAEFKMDPLVSFYYFAPICAAMNGVIGLIVEGPGFTMDHLYRIGPMILLLNALIAFCLNVALVTLIGKTSSLVLTLCGVLKDILLVMASMAIWGKPVSGTQWFGYCIALGGLVYYKLGYQQITGYASEGQRRWAEYGATRPAQRKMIIFGAVIMSLFVVYGWLSFDAGIDTSTAAAIPKRWSSTVI